MAYVIIGATGELGRALAKELAAAGHGLVLVGRREAALAKLAQEIGESAAGTPATVAADVTQGAGYIDRVRDAAEVLDGVDGLMLPLGAAIRDDLATPPAAADDLVRVNFTAVAEAVAALWGPLSAAPRPAVVGFGSVAGLRGRRRNLLYGAAKRALQHYFEGLRLVGAEAGIAVQFYIVGFLASAPRKDAPRPLPKGDPARLAARVVHNLGRGSGVYWFPRWWAPIGAVLRLLPAGLYRRIAAASGGAGTPPPARSG